MTTTEEAVVVPGFQTTAVTKQLPYSGVTDSDLKPFPTLYSNFRFPPAPLVAPSRLATMDDGSASPIQVAIEAQLLAICHDYKKAEVAAEYFFDNAASDLRDSPMQRNVAQTHLEKTLFDFNIVCSEEQINKILDALGNDGLIESPPSSPPTDPRHYLSESEIAHLKKKGYIFPDVDSAR